METPKSNTTIRKLIGLVACCVAFQAQTAAQGLGIEVDGGLQGTQYQLNNGQNTLLPGGTFGLFYTFRLGSRWGLTTGVSGGIYRTRATLPDGIVFSTYEVDDQGSAFQYTMKTEGYKETQQFFTAAIPLRLQYHTAGAHTQWYLEAGGKVLLPSTATIDISAQQLNLSAYYPDYNLNISNLPQHGLGTVNGWKTSTSAQLKPAATLNAATGLSFRLSRGARLFTGLYVEYGLTDLRNKPDSLPLVTFSPTGIDGVRANSVLNTANSGQAKILAVGFQLKLSFGGARTTSSVRPKAKKPSAAVPGNPPLTKADTLFIQRPVIFGVIDEIAISDVEKPHLNDLADIMLQYPAIRISLVGHICNSGTETEDPNVGLARARAVARFLRDRGIDRNRMDVSSTSESDPVLLNNPGANFQKRRVVITME